MEHAYQIRLAHAGDATQIATIYAYYAQETA